MNFKKMKILDLSVHFKIWNVNCMILFEIILYIQYSTKIFSICYTYFEATASNGCGNNGHKKCIPHNPTKTSGNIFFGKGPA